MKDKRFEKLLNLTITKQDLESLLIRLGFEKKPGKGSHVKWLKAHCPPIIVATHSKEIKHYQLRQIIKILKDYNLIT